MGSFDMISSMWHRIWLQGQAVPLHTGGGGGAMVEVIGLAHVHQQLLLGGASGHETLYLVDV